MRPPTFQCSAADLAATVVTAHLGEAHAPGKNLVWCVTFQLAWNELAARVGAPVVLSPPAPLADALNRSAILRDILDEPSFVARAGFGADGIMEAIQRELAEKFGPNQSDLLPPYLSPDSLLAFAFLLKSLGYAVHFEYEPAGLRFGDRDVAAFGIWGDDPSEGRGRQVRIHDYGGPDDFVIELFTKNREDRILVAKVTPGATLEATITAVRARLGRLDVYSAPHSPGERVAIPCLDFSILRTYGELAGHRIENTEGRGIGIDVALQSIRLQFDEKGAILKSEAVVRGFGPPGKPGTRTFVCDKPFLVLLLRKTATVPYLALWIDNTELLQPSS